MPPGQHHAVYTPVASFSRGGHYLNLDMMHLTELSRFVDRTHGKFVTNEVHHGTLETLCRMVISLTILPISRSESRPHSANSLQSAQSELYKRSLIALCGMVAHHQCYVSQGTAPQESVTLGMASTIAEAVLAHFGLKNLKQYRAFLAGTDMFDRGEVVEMHAFLHSLRLGQSM